MQTIKQSILSIAIGLALVAGISYAEWKGATANPPLNNAPAPINVGSTEQDFSSGKTLKVKGGSGVLNLVSGLKINGIFSLIDGTQGAGKILTSDADGKASWLPASGGGSGVGGSGTTNYISKWITGTTLGNSQVFDNGINVGIGTVSPEAKLDINGSLSIKNAGKRTVFSSYDGANYIRGKTIIADDNSYVGIGTVNPQAKLDIIGKIKISDGTQGSGKVLTSDASGNASWMASGGGGGISGYEVKTATGYTIITAYCSVSKKILGGGCSGQSYDVDGYPIISGNNGWECRTEADQFPTTAHAICAN